MVRFALFLSLVCCTIQESRAQVDTSKVFRVVLTDGSELVGTIRQEDDEKLTFRSFAGVEMKILRSQIRELSEMEGEWHGREFRRNDPNRTRLFFSPTARTLSAGNGYFSAYQIFFPFLAVGVTDCFTLSGGMSLFPGADSQLLYLAPKVRLVHTDQFDLAGGVLYFRPPERDEGGGIFYGVTSFGSSQAALTCGLGWGFSGDDVADSPILLLGGELQVSNSLKFLTENWIPLESDVAIITFGMRFFGDKLAADLGLITSTKPWDGFPFFPWIGFSYNF